MAKRYTDTDKWRKEWFCELKPAHKALWAYLTDTCTNAGIWEVNWKLASFSVGAKIDPAEVSRVFSKQYVPLDGGRRWFLKDFIEFQHGRINPNNPAHRNIIPVLQSYGLLDSNLHISLPADNIEGASKGLQRDSDVPMVMVTATVKVNKGGVGGSADHPILADPAVRQAWENFRADRKERRRPMTVRAEGMALKTLEELSLGDPALAVKIVNQSIERGWQGLFELKENRNGHSKAQPGSQAARAAYRPSEQSRRDNQSVAESIRRMREERGERA